jgi:hypothetical protein
MDQELRTLSALFPRAWRAPDSTQYESSIIFPEGGCWLKLLPPRKLARIIFRYKMAEDFEIIYN